MHAPVEPTTSEPVPAEEPAPVGLTFADGFQFGCGFMLAVVLSMLISALAIIVLVLLLSLAGLQIL